jgi:hypothetical protein
MALRTFSNALIDTYSVALVERDSNWTLAALQSCSCVSFMLFDVTCPPYYLKVTIVRISFSNKVYIFCKIWGFHGVTTQKTPFVIYLLLRSRLYVLRFIRAPSSPPRRSRDSIIKQPMLTSKYFTSHWSWSSLMLYVGTVTKVGGKREFP